MRGGKMGAMICRIVQRALLTGLQEGELCDRQTASVDFTLNELLLSAKAR